MSYQQIVYDELRRQGMTEAGALGTVGNFDCESNCEPFRKQGDFSPYRTLSKAYVADVTNNRISRDQFARDGYGFGIYQLTYWTRKAGYWDFWKASGKALDSAELQVQYAVKEMKADYPNLWTFLTKTNDVFTATSRVCREFERPAVNNIDARYASANRIKHEIDLNAWEDSSVEPEPAPQPEPAVDHSLKLRTIDKNCEDFLESHLLYLLLKCRDYGLETSNGMWQALVQFQKDFGLEPDGVCGPKTWAKLLER